MAVTAAIMCLYLFVFATEMQTPYGGGETLMIVSITSGVLAFVILIAMACITSLQRLTRYLHNPFPTTKIVNRVNIKDTINTNKRQIQFLCINSRMICYAMLKTCAN